jgi:hypothetical protein
VGGERYDLSGFRVADFFGGAADGAEGTEATESDRFFVASAWVIFSKRARRILWLLT